MCRISVCVFVEDCLGLRVEGDEEQQLRVGSETHEGHTHARHETRILFKEETDLNQ